MTHTAWVTIGHDGAPDPTEFDATIRRHLSAVATIVTEAATMGEWQGEPEQGRAFLIEYPADLDSLIRAQLQVDAARFGQDAIGFVGTGGGATLVTP